MGISESWFQVILFWEFRSLWICSANECTSLHRWCLAWFFQALPSVIIPLLQWTGTWLSPYNGSKLQDRAHTSLQQYNSMEGEDNYSRTQERCFYEGCGTSIAIWLLGFPFWHLYITILLNEMTSLNSVSIIIGLFRLNLVGTKGSRGFCIFYL